MQPIEIPWPVSGSGGISEVQFTMVPDEVFACHFRTPADLGPKSGHISLFEYNGQPCQRMGCLSLTQGDLDAPIKGNGTQFNGDIGVSISFMGSAGQKKHEAVLTPNTDYYLNVQLVNPPDGGQFSSKVEFQKPRS